MESKAKIFGHAIHPILIVFPLGLLATAVIFDVIYLATANRLYFIAANGSNRMSRAEQNMKGKDALTQ